jgi:small subunit ribosomal protein S2
MNEGLQESKAEKIDTEAAGEGEAAPKRERKAKAGVKRTRKEDEEALNARVVGKFVKDIEE